MTGCGAAFLALHPSFNPRGGLYYDESDAAVRLKGSEKCRRQSTCVETVAMASTPAVCIYCADAQDPGEFVSTGKSSQVQRAGCEAAQQHIGSLDRRGASNLCVPRTCCRLFSASRRCRNSGGSGIGVLNNTSQIVTQSGNLLTPQFVFGARRALETARQYDIKIAVLTDGSPSCGSTYIYDGSFSGIKLPGSIGVTTALLSTEGLEVFSQFQLFEADRRLLELDRGHPV